MLKLNIQLFADGGTLVIGTELDTSPLDKKLNKLQTKLENEKVDLDISFSRSEDVKFKLQETSRELDNLKKKQQELAREIPKKEAEYKALIEKIQIGEGLTPVDYLNYDKLGTIIDNLRQEQILVNKQVDACNEKVNNLDFALAKAESSYDKQRDKVTQTTAEVVKLKSEVEKMNSPANLFKQSIENAKEETKNIGDSIKNVIKKVGKWALAVFGVRTAYNAIRSAISILSTYDKQMGANIEWIRYLLASTLKPVIEWLINAVYTLLVYLRYILKAWFNIDIFANASKKQFNSMNKSAKQLQKTLAGFDEMNILGDNKASGDAGVSPSLPDMKNVEIPEWIKWIAKHKDEILKFFILLGAIIAAIKIGKFLSDFSGFFEFIGSHAQVIAGIAIAIWGVAIAIEGVIKFIKDPSFDNFIQILEGIAIAVLGIAIAVGAWPVAIGAALALVVLLVVKYFDEIMGFFEGIINWFDINFLGALRTLFGPIGDIIYLPIKFAIELLVGAFEAFFGGIKKIVEGIVMIFKGQFFEGLKKVFGGLVSVFTAPAQALNRALDKTWQQIKKSVGYWVEEFKKGFSKIKEKMQEPINKFIDAVKGLWDKIKSSVQEVGNKIADALNPAKLVEKAKSKINSAGQSIKSFFGFAKGGVVYHSLPKLAPGGIINQPGRGVPLGSAIGGERGAEGVIPLTDSQQMALLGEAIGRYITINANIVNTMNGRVISKELQKVQNESDFAFNR